MSAATPRNDRGVVNRMPGFSYDARTKTAHFDIYVDGGKGRIRRRRTIPAANAQEAKRLWAAFCDELAHPGAMRQDFSCVTPRETAQSHRILTAALISNRLAQVVSLEGEEV